MKQTIKELKFNFIQKYITIMYILKVNYGCKEVISQILLFLIYIQPLFITLQNSIYQPFKTNWIYHFLEIIFRPDLAFTKYANGYIQYMFIIPLIIVIACKIGSLTFLFLYFSNKQQDHFLKQTQSNLVYHIISFLLNIYQRLISTFLFNIFALFCITNLIVLQSSQIYIISFIIIFILLIFLVIEQFFHLQFLDTNISNTVFGMDKHELTFSQYLYTILIDSTILFTIEIDSKYSNLIISLIILTCQILLLYDILINSIYVLSYQREPIIISISVNITFHLINLIFSTDFYQQKKLTLLIFFLLIYTILQKINKDCEQQQLISLFKKEISNYKIIKQGLIKLFFNDGITQSINLIINSLIAQWHNKQCSNEQCSFCKQIFLMQPRQSCSITKYIYSSFLQEKIKWYLYQFKLQNKESNQQQMLIQYSFFLYDFGWTLKSIQLLFQLHQNYKYRSFQKEQQNIKYKTTLNLPDNQYNNEQIEIELISPQTLSFIEEIKLSFLLKEGKIKIKSSLGTSLLATQQSIINQFIEKHLKKILQYDYFIQQIEQLIEDKLIFFNILLKNQELFSTYDHLNDQIFKICTKINKIEEQVQKEYQIQPTPELHKLICFFYGEILHNYHSSINFYKNSKQFEYEELIQQQVKNFNINSDVVDFVILKTEDDMQHLEVIKYSHSFFQNFGNKNMENHIFSELLPKNLIPHHKYFVKTFFETGQARFYKMFSINYVKNKNSLLTSVNMCFTITNIFQQNNITFAAFLQKASFDQVFIIVDGENFTCTFTENLLNLIGWNNIDIIQLCQTENYEAIDINKLFPSFQKLCKQINNQQLKINSIQLLLPKPPNLQYNNNTKGPRSLILEAQSSVSASVTYVTIECDVIIEKKIILNYTYFVINIVRIIEQNRPAPSTQRFSHSRISEDSLKMNANLSQQTVMEEELQIGKLNLISFQFKTLPNSIMKLEKEQFNDKINNSTSKYDILYDNQQVNLQSPNHCSEIQFLNNTSNKQCSNQQNQFNRSNQTTLQVQNIQIIYNQQQFISDNNLNEYSDSEQNNQLKYVKQQKQNKKVNKEYDILNQQMNQKYELIQQVLDSESPIELKKFIIFFNLYMIGSIILIILQLIEISNDLQINVNDINLISIESSIMGTFDLFFSMQMTIKYYQSLYQDSFITELEMQQLISPYLNIINQGYEEFQKNTFNTLNQNQIDIELYSQQIQTNFMQSNITDLTTLNGTILEAIFILIQYQYIQTQALIQQQNTNIYPSEIFEISNYINLQTVLKNIQIDSHSKINEETNFNQNKYLVIFIVAFFIFTFLYIFIQYYQYHYLQWIDQLIALINQQNYDIIQSEINQLIKFQSSFNENKYFINSYDPTLLYENQLKQVSKGSSLLKEKQVSQKHIIKNLSKKKIKNYMLPLCIFIIIIVYLLLMYFQLLYYLIKQYETAQFFSIISDLKFHSGSLYIYRELLLQQTNFPYLTNQDILDIQLLLIQSVQEAHSFLLVPIKLHPEKYLIDSIFINFFYQIQESNLCDYIDESIYQFLYPYCELSFESSLKKGMMQSLNFIVNQINSTFYINNFTKRIDGQKYELEGSQIIIRVFFNLTNKLLQSINNVREQYFDFFVWFSSILLFFSILIIILVTKYYMSYLYTQQKVCKRVIHLIPFQILSNDEKLQRKLKTIMSFSKKQN